MYFQSKLLLDAKADPNITNTGGHTALTGLEGTKTGLDAWDNPMNILKAAEERWTWWSWWSWCWEGWQGTMGGRFWNTTPIFFEIDVVYNNNKNNNNKNDNNNNDNNSNNNSNNNNDNNTNNNIH